MGHLYTVKHVFRAHRNIIEKLLHHRFLNMGSNCPIKQCPLIRVSLEDSKTCDEGKGFNVEVQFSSQKLQFRQPDRCPLITGFTVLKSIYIYIYIYMIHMYICRQYPLMALGSGGNWFLCSEENLATLSCVTDGGLSVCIHTAGNLPFCQRWYLARVKLSVITLPANHWSIAGTKFVIVFSTPGRIDDFPLQLIYRVFFSRCPNIFAPRLICGLLLMHRGIDGKVSKCGGLFSDLI